MNQKLLLTSLLAATLALPAAAQTAAPTAPADMTDGEVRKVDKDAGKLTLKHGEIRSLDMPPMTMVFTVKDKAMLDKLQPGDKVKFKAVSDGGRILIIEIESAN